MSAFMHLREMRKKLEQIEFVNTMQTAMSRDSKKIMERWARHAEIELRWED